MRPSLVAVVALVAAAVGGAVVAAFVAAAGWPSEREARTVVVTQPAPPSAEEPVRERIDPPKATANRRFDPAAIYAARSPGVVTIYAFFGEQALEEDFFNHGAQGSGFVASRRGHVLTNAHVVTNTRGEDVEPAEKVYVEFEDGDRVPATVVGWDVFNDIGVVKVDPTEHPLRPLPLGDSRGVVVGEPVAAIGSPFGRQNTLTVGVVSATERTLPSLSAHYDLVGAIQTDAAINHGNSGGPLFDARGRVIGVNAQMRSNSGVSAGVGFAVPINSARRSFEQIVATGRVRYAYVGVTADDLTPALARRFDYAAPYGAVVACVKEGSPGAKAGLHDGDRSEPAEGGSFIEGADLIVAIDGEPVRSGSDLVRIISERLEPGRIATFTIFRGAERRRVRVKLAERPERPPTCEP